MGNNIKNNKPVVSKENIPLTEGMLTELGFRLSCPDYLICCEYRRDDTHPDGKAYMMSVGGGLLKGVMLEGEEVEIRTKQDLINYLANPARHKG